MNTNANPAAESPSDSRDNPCISTDLNIAALDVFADDGISYLLPYTNYVNRLV